MSAADAAAQKKIYGSNATELIILNKEIEDLTKIIKQLKQSGLIIKGISETIENEAKEQRGGCYQEYQLLVYQEMNQQEKE